MSPRHGCYRYNIGAGMRASRLLTVINDGISRTDLRLAGIVARDCDIPCGN